MLKVVCVLKSGGDYDWEYVSRLCQNLKEHLTLQHEFFCLTDIPNKYSFIRQVPLEKNLMSYWSKIEVFRSKGEVLYLDLDTIIVKNINSMIENIRQLVHSALLPNMFFMLKAWKKKEEWASGIMYWDGDMRWLYDKLTEHDITSYGKWEQRYIKDQLFSEFFDIISFSDKEEEIRSYKHHCKNEIPEGTKIITFHGKPRPRTVGWLERSIQHQI